MAIKLTLIGALAVAGLVSPCEAGGVRVAYLHRLADFSGIVPFGDVRLYVDPRFDEIYVSDANDVRIFNGSGMEIYRFGNSPGFGSLRDLAVDENGDILILSYDFSTPADGNEGTVLRCDYRGELKSRLWITGLPPELSWFKPNRMRYRDGRFYFASSTAMVAVVTDRTGRFERAYDLADLIGLDEEERSVSDLSGFHVDAAGNLLFTVPVQFAAFVVSPQGVVRSFGEGGSGPGRFGLVSDVVADDHGNHFVADKLRSVVLVFNKKLEFVEEFGYYSLAPDGLIRPRSLALDGAGRLYVTQMRRNGVSVFSVKPE